MGKSQKTPPLAVGMNGKAGDLGAAAPRGFSLKKPRRFAPGSFTTVILRSEATKNLVMLTKGEILRSLWSLRMTDS